MGRSNELHYFVKRCGAEALLESDVAENLLVSTMMEGKSADFEEASVDGTVLDETGSYLCDTAWSAEEEFAAERKNLDDDEKRERLGYLTRDYDAKINTIKELIERQNEDGTDPKIIHMNEGKLDRNVKRFMKEKNEIESRETRITPGEIAMGIIHVTEE